MPGVEFLAVDKAWGAALNLWKTGINPIVYRLLADAKKFDNLRNIIRVSFPDFVQGNLAVFTRFHSAYPVGYSDVDVKRLEATQASRSATVYTTRRPSLLYAGPVP